MKDEKSITVTNPFQKILHKSRRKPNKIWIDKGSEFYNRSMKSWLEDSNIEMYSTHNEGKFKTTRFQKMQLRIFLYIFFEIQNNSDQFWFCFNSISGSGDNFWVTSDPIVSKGYIIEISLYR